MGSHVLDLRMLQNNFSTEEMRSVNLLLDS
jgi:hypothetical protein